MGIVFFVVFLIFLILGLIYAMYRRNPWNRRERLIDESSTGFVNPAYSATAEGGEIIWKETARAEKGDVDGHLQGDLPETLNPASLSGQLKRKNYGVGDETKVNSDLVDVQSEA